MNHPRDLSDPPRSPERADRPPIEIEGQGAEAREREELRAVALLLRSLPDPEPPETLVPRVLERASARETRPLPLRAAGRVLGALADPPIALALAAGVAGLLALVSYVEQGSLLAPSPAEPPALEARRGEAAVARAPVPRVGRSAPPPMPSGRVVNPHFVSLFNSYPQAPTPRLAPERGPTERVEQGLDQQLNRLLLDPTAYCRRLERIPQRDAFMARLALRSAERGDAIEVALRVRQADHPLGKQLADRLMQAAFAQRIAPR